MKLIILGHPNDDDGSRGTYEPLKPIVTVNKCKCIFCEREPPQEHYATK